MAHKKGQGSSRNGRDSNPQYRGVKMYAGQAVKARLDPRPAVRHEVLPRPQRRHGQGLHALRRGRGNGAVPGPARSRPLIDHRLAKSWIQRDGHRPSLFSVGGLCSLTKPKSRSRPATAATVASASAGRSSWPKGGRTAAMAARAGTCTSRPEPTRTRSWTSPASTTGGRRTASTARARTCTAPTARTWSSPSRRAH